MSNCPYCQGTSLTVVTGARPRPETEVTVQCSDCSGFSMRHSNGRIFPLEDRTDVDSDAVSRVIDE